MHRLLLALVAALAPSLGLAAGISVAPMLIDKTITPEDNELELTIANASASPVTFELSTSPMQHSPAGEAIEGPADYPYDVSKLIQVPKDRVTVKPKRWRRVRLKVDVPNRSGGGYAFIHARTLPDLSSKAQVLASLDFRVIVEVTFRGSTRKAVQIANVIADKAGMRVAVRNDGDAHVRPQGTLELKDDSGKVAFSSALASENVFPSLTRELKLAQPPPVELSGRYTAVVRLSSPTPQAVERSVVVSNGQLALQPAGAP